MTSIHISCVWDQKMFSGRISGHFSWNQWLFKRRVKGEDKIIFWFHRGAMWQLIRQHGTKWSKSVQNLRPLCIFVWWKKFHFHRKSFLSKVLSFWNPRIDFWLSNFGDRFFFDFWWMLVPFWLLCSWFVIDFSTTFSSMILEWILIHFFEFPAPLILWKSHFKLRLFAKNKN